MSLSVNTINSISFTNKPQQQKDAAPKSAKIDTSDNPISKRGERMKLFTATLLAGLGVGARALWYLSEDGFAFEHIENASKKLSKKYFSNIPKNKRLPFAILGTLGLMGVFIGGIALLYTIYKAPKIAYDGKVNAFKKGKEMDVYIKSNAVEKNLYSKINEEAKDADEQKKEQLKQNFATLNLAGSRVPDFINIKR